MIAALLTDETLILDNVPRLADVAQVQRILGNHGVDIMSAGKRPGDHEYQGQTLHISAANIIDTTAPYELVSTMRANSCTPVMRSMSCLVSSPDDALSGEAIPARNDKHARPALLAAASGGDHPAQSTSMCEGVSRWPA